MNKANNLIKQAIDSGDYIVDENGNVFKCFEHGKNIEPRKVALVFHKNSGRMRLRIYGYKAFLHRVVGYNKFGDDIFNYEIHHIDENPLNNHPSNLGLATRGYHLRVIHAGENNKSSKLKWPEINMIRKLYAQGNYTYPKLAQLFKVSTKTIAEIVKGISWKNTDLT